VRRLYYNYFGRLPSDEELRFHVNSGQSREQLTINFLNSAEFNGAGRFVAGLYVGLLNRDAEYGGWLFQRDALARGFTNHDTMVSTFITGAEFQLKFGPLTNSQFVTLMYTQILGRVPSPEELTWRVGLLEGGFTRVALARDLLNSTEFRQGKNARLLSFLLHATILNRDPTLTEFTQRRDQIATLPTDATTSQILAELVQSVEVRMQVQ
jgi:hypothetical protein